MLPVVLSVLLVVAVGAVGYLGGHHWRARDTSVDAPAATRGATPAPTPSALVAATQAPRSPAPAAAGLVPRAARVAAALGPLLKAPVLGGGVRALVVDGASGAALLEQGAGDPSPPASTTKLTTATALLATVGAGFRITTRVVAGPRPGQIVLVGGGDPTLSAAAAGRPTTYAGAARVSTLAAQVKAAHPSKITSILVDSGLFTGPLEAPGWQPEDVPSDYASAITATVVDGGRPAGGGTERSADPDLEAGRALAVRLGLPRVPVQRGRAAASAATLATVRSATVLDMIEEMMATSDNVIAEMLGRQVARVEHQPLSFAGTVVAVRRALASIGVTIPATLSDASGLSVRDRLTPASLVAVVRAALFGAHPQLGQLVSTLPVAGWDGTLATRFQVPASAAGAGQVRAKTGTLTGVVTLAGIARDRTGRVLVFALMAGHVGDADTEPAEAAVDAAAARLVTCRCR